MLIFVRGRNFCPGEKLNFLDMEREDDQELWDLLGKSSQPTLSPFFARNVVRQVREGSDWREALLGWLAPKVLVPAAAAALAVAAAVVALRDSPTGANSVDEVPATVAQLNPEDYEVVAALDDLLASEEEESLWEDT